MFLVFATHNRHKADEIQAMLPPGTELKTLTELGVTEDIPETGSTLLENARLKAQYVWHRLAVPCFADDTGLEVAALNNEPGVYSARYAGEQKNSDANIELLLQRMEGISNRKARFRTVICFIDRNGEQLFEGCAEGSICHEPAGVHGFGYDPVFIPEGRDTTFAQLNMAEKNTLSHRAKAFNLFVKALPGLMPQ